MIHYRLSRTGIFACLSIIAPLAIAESVPLVTFEGRGTVVTERFEAEAPWLVTWSVASDSPLTANIRIRLMDGESERYIGDVVELAGTGGGMKLFEQGGEFRFDIGARDVKWQLHVERTDEATAASLKSGQEDALPLLYDDPDNFSGWSALDERTLQLVDANGADIRIVLRSACPGLVTATKLSFVAPMGDGDTGYDSVLLEDGTRCYFEKISPWQR